MNGNEARKTEAGLLEYFNKVVKKTIFICGSGDDDICSGKAHGIFGREQISHLMGIEKNR